MFHTGEQKSAEVTFARGRRILVLIITKLYSNCTFQVYISLSNINYDSIRLIIWIALSLGTNTYACIHLVHFLWDMPI